MYVPFRIDDAGTQLIDVRHIQRQGLQVGPFGGKQFASAGMQLVRESRVPLLARGARPLVQVLPVGEVLADQKSLLDAMERCLDPRRAIGIALLVGDKDKAVAFGEGDHLGRRDHRGAGAGGDYDVGVIEHAALGRPAEVGDRLRQKGFALKAREARIVLKENHARMTQHQRGALYAGHNTVDLRLVWARIVLHLTARIIEISPGRRWRGAADAVAATKRRQRRIRHRGAALLERPMHAPQMPLVPGVEFQDLLAPRFGQLRAHQRRHGGAVTGDHAAYRIARHP